MGALAALIGRLVAWLGRSTLLRWLTTEAVMFGALKFLGRTLLYLGLPIIIYNVLAKYSYDIFQLILGQIGTFNLQPVVLEITGIAGWIGTQIGITNLFSAYMSAIATRFTIDMFMRRF